MKIRTRIGLYFIVIFSIIILVTSFVIGFYFYNLSKTQIFSYLFSSSKDKAEHIISVVKSKKETSEILAAASVYRDFLKEPENSNQYLVIKEKIDKRLFRTMEIDSNLSEVFILNKFGKVVGSSDKAQEGKDKSNDLYFTQSLKETYIKDIYFSESTKKNKLYNIFSYFRW